MIDWPSTLPLPQFGLQYNIIDPVRRTQFLSGRSISRRRFSDVPTEFAARWVLTDAEAIAFDSLYQDDLVDGTQWARMPLVTAGGLHFNYVRFRGGYSRREIGPRLWEYSANMQMYLRAASGLEPPGIDGGGGSWEWGPLPQGLNSGSPAGAWISALAASGDVWVAGASNGHAARSEDKGVTWSQLPQFLNSGASGVYGLSSLAVSGDVWVAGFSYGYAARSEDKGVTWSQLPQFLNSGASGSAGFYGLAASGDVWVAGAGNGYAARSEDNGVTWTALPRGLNSGVPVFQSQPITSLAASGDVWVAGARNGYAARSEDNGVTWTALPRGLNTGASAYPLASIAASGDVWVAGVGNVSGSGGLEGSASRSEDGGVTWSPLPQWLNSGHAGQPGLSKLAASGDVWVAGFASDGFGAGGGYASLSEDKGATWSPLPQGLNSGAPSTSPITALAVSGDVWVAGLRDNYAARSPPLP